MTQQNRAAMTLVTRRARAYFAPASAQALDLSLFATDPPSGWTDLGWVENLKRTSGTRMEPIRAGARGAPAGQYRSTLDARLEWDFPEWGKLQMTLSSGGQSMNVLSGGAVPLSPQSSRAQLILQTDGAVFAVGDLVAVDIDYTGQTGPVGTGVAMAYVANAADARNDQDYVRRVTLNVGRVSAVEDSSVSLQQPLPCALPDGAKAQKLIAFADCEGGGFVPEWSAVFVAESEAGGRVCWYYPRLQSAAGTQESVVELAEPLDLMALHASFCALPVEAGSLLCYRVLYPAANAAVY